MHNDLCPDRDHSDEQRERGQRGSFLNDGPNHGDSLPFEQNGNIVLFLFWSQATVVGQFEIRHGWTRMIGTLLARPELTWHTYTMAPKFHGTRQELTDRLLPLDLDGDWEEQPNGVW